MQGNVRWMIRDDLKYVVAIEKESYPNPWSEKDFIHSLRQRNIIGKVVEVDGEVCGFMVYEVNKGGFRVLNIAVAPKYRRIGVGRMMAKHLFAKLNNDRRTYVELEVRETNLDAQLFFRSVGFRALRTLKDRWDDSNEDAYLFRRNYQPAMECSL